MFSSNQIHTFRHILKSEGYGPSALNPRLFYLWHAGPWGQTRKRANSEMNLYKYKLTMQTIFLSGVSAFMTVQ